MARTVDRVAHAVRRDAFLDAGQRLIQTKGYAQLSIQDVVVEASASKGAFYHYFDSKAALLEAIVDRMTDAIITSVQPAVADPGRSALQKLDAVLGGMATFKTARKDLMIALMRVWASDDNAVMRAHFRRGLMARMVPMFATIIEQGVAEGAFSVDTPASTARVFLALMLGANEEATAMFVDRPAGELTLDEVHRELQAFGDAFERILGAAPGSLGFAERFEIVRDWFDDLVAVSAEPAGLQHAEEPHHPMRPHHTRSHRQRGSA